HVGPGAASALRGMLFERATVDYRVAELTSAPQGEDGGWRSRAVIARGGTLQLPVTVRLELIDGQRIDRRWSGVEPVFVVEQEHEAPLARVVVDPEQAVLWDRDLLNNSRSLERQSTLRSSERAWYWAELLLHLLGP
ncbi:MAG: M1 family peptidase, partial [Myxococcales bacterium]|nr:M1 family peptidase [Myxococcales bacterium]